MEEPREFQSIKRILASMSLKYTDDVPLILHEFFERYVSEVVATAKVHAERRNDIISAEDVDLAIATRTQFAFCSGPGIEELKQQAAAINKEKKLPNVSVTMQFCCPKKSFVC
jgi:hypothetical protein